MLANEYSTLKHGLANAADRAEFERVAQRHGLDLTVCGDGSDYDDPGTREAAEVWLEGKTYWRRTWGRA